MNIAIVGATGNVGRKTLEVLEKKNFSINNLYLIASSNLSSPQKTSLLYMNEGEPKTPIS